MGANSTSLGENPLKRFALLAAAALVLTGCAGPAAPSPDIQEKADKFAAGVKATMAAEEAAYQESLKIKLVKPADRPMRVMLAGDSLGVGYYASTKAKSFKSIVAAQIGDVEFLEPTQRPGKLSTVDRIVEVPMNLDLAIIELGTNDVGIPVELETFKATYSRLLAKIQRSSPGVKFMCASTWAKDSPSFDDAIKGMCDTVDGAFVDLRQVKAAPENRGPKGRNTEFGASDAFHPNDAGHKAIADAILKLIRFV
jgi:lysophospholipase L1-like esterase